MILVTKISVCVYVCMCVYVCIRCVCVCVWPCHLGHSMVHSHWSSLEGATLLGYEVIYFPVQLTLGSDGSHTQLADVQFGKRGGPYTQTGSSTGYMPIIIYRRKNTNKLD